MTVKENRRTETVIYCVAWLIVIGLYLLDTMQNRSRMSESLIDLTVVVAMIKTLLPFVALFVINDCILIPRLLLRNRLKCYLAVTAFIILALWAYQYYDFTTIENARRHVRPPMPPHPAMRPLIPLPVLLDLIYSLLVVGFNIAVTLVFRRFDDALERESLLKANAENQLAYLKAQINPHFYMNMLNNIHGMIEIDQERAQAMVIDLSNLMRYMLYDSSKPMISLADEIAFLSNYINLMRQRYPEDKVCITTRFPLGSSTKGISLPPLLFLVFIENAFKHGVSYRKASLVDVSIDISGNKLLFHCVNSINSGSRSVKESSGIGLKNIRRRLDLLYGDRAELDLMQSDTTYTVTLSIPIQNVKDTDH